jgi:protein-tyrosine kinase
MSRIHKALQKARDKRQEQQVANGNSSPLEKIVYSISKVMPIQNETLERNHVVSRSTSDPRSQIFRTLRTDVVKKMRANNWRSIGITSPSYGEGKSLIASNLSAAIAMEVNHTALLVDMDLRTPCIKDFFSIDPSEGLLDYLKGTVEIADLLVNPGMERLLLLPGVGTAENSAEWISTPKMVALFNEVTQRYKSRLVVYDLPPILPRDDVMTCVNHIDCFLLVIEEGKNSEAEIRKAIQTLDNCNLVGTVVNKSHTEDLVHKAPTFA